MATRGDLNIGATTVGAKVEILRRYPFESIPMTLDFTDAEEDKETGKKIIKAGTPIDKDGKKVENPWNNVRGILLHDTYEDNPHAALLVKAYIDRDVAETHSEVTYDDDLLKLLPMIVLEDTGKE